MPFIPDRQQTGFKPDKKTFGGFLGNIATSGARAVGDIGQALLDPIGTVKGLGNLVRGIGQKFTPGVQEQESQVDAIADFYRRRYGGLQNIGETLYRDPVGAGLDIAAVTTGVGAGLKTLGTASKLSGLSRAGRFLTRAGSTIDPLAIAGRGIRSVTGKFNLRPQALAKAERTAVSGLGSPARQTRAAAKSGRSVGSFIDEFDLFGRDPADARAVKRSIGKKFDVKATQTGKNIKVSQIVNAIDDKIAELSKGTGGVVSRNTKSQIAELTRQKNQFIKSISKEVRTPVEIPVDSAVLDQFGQPFQTTRTSFTKDLKTPRTTSLRKATEFRRKVIDPDIPKSEFGLSPRETGKAGGTKGARDIFRAETINVAPELRKLGMDFGMAIEVEKIIQSYAERASNRQRFNFTKLGGAGIGGLVSGVKGVLGGFISEQFLNSPQMTKILSRALKRYGESQVRQIPQGVTQGARGVSIFGRTGRLFNAGQRGKPKSTRGRKSTPLLQTSTPSISRGKSDSIITKVKAEFNVPSFTFSKRFR